MDFVYDGRLVAGIVHDYDGSLFYIIRNMFSNQSLWLSKFIYEL
jgi:hypothetical protein